MSVLRHACIASKEIAMNRPFLLLLGTLLCTLLPLTAQATAADDYVPFDLLTPPGAAAGRSLGQAMAVEGDLAVVGAPGEPADSSTTIPGSPLYGAVYVYTQEDGRWRQRARLSPTDGTISMAFGSAVAIRDGQILVGAPNVRLGSPFLSPTGGVFVYDGSGASWSESQRLHDATSSGFGSALAADAANDRLLVGAKDESGGGAAYLYSDVAGSWAAPVRLVASNRTNGAQFGRTAALHGDRAVIGAPFTGAHNLGSAYVFERSGAAWNEAAALTPSSDTSAYTGWSLAIHGDDLLVGAIQHDAAGVDRSGAVFHYRRGGSGWLLQREISAPTKAILQVFGQSLAFDGTQLFIAASGEAGPWTRRGRIYLSTLQPTGFDAPQALPDNPVIQVAGRSLALSGSVLLSGAPFDDVGEVSNEGRVASYRKLAGVWRSSGVLDAPMLAPSTRFGYALAMSGNRAAVGMPWQTVAGGSQRGAVHLFAFDGLRWQRTATVTDPVGSANDRFGSSVALDGDDLAVGAPNRTNSGVSAGGSGLLFHYDGSAWNLDYRYDNTSNSNARMGEAVAVRGNRAAIGAPRSTFGGHANGGHVLVVERSGGSWGASADLTGSAAQERLGSTLAISDISVAAGATAGNGHVRIYRKVAGSWSQLTQLSAPADAAGFGTALAFDRGNLLAIGAPYGNTGFGRVMVYREGVTSVTAEILPSIGSAARNLGRAVAIDGDRLVVGSADLGSSPQAMHVFDRSSSGVWSYGGRRDSPDGTSLLGDGFAGGLALARPHLLVGADLRSRDEGRVLAYVEPNEVSLFGDSITPSEPLVGQTFSMAVSVSAAGGPPAGRVSISLATGGRCEATLAAGAGQCDLSSTSAGTHAVIATFIPDTLPATPVTAAGTVTVLPAATSVSLTAAPATAHPGQTITLSASLTAVAPGSGTPAGQISFHRASSANPALCTTSVAAAHCDALAGSVGSESYVARYLGSADFTAADSAARVVTITPWATSVNMDAPVPAAPAVGQPLTAQVSVGADPAAGVPVGRVRLLVDGAPGDWTTLDGVGKAQPAASLPSIGTHQLVAEFDGQGGDFADADSAPRNVNAQGIVSTLNMSATPSSGLHAGDSVTVALGVVLADASAATGSIKLYRDSTANPPLCTVTAPPDSCSYQLPTAGGYLLIAEYSGDPRALPDSAQIVLNATRRPSATVIQLLSPAVPRVDQPYSVQVTVSSDFGTIAGSVTVSDGSGSCVIALSASNSCQMAAATRGPRSLSAYFASSNSVHADSESADYEVEVEGIPTALSLDFPPVSYRVGDNIALQPVLAGTGGDHPDSGLVTLRRDGPAGAVICTRNLPLTACDFVLDTAGFQHFHLSYDGSPRHAPSDSGSIAAVVDAIVSVLDLAGSEPAAILSGQPMTLLAAVSSDRGTPPGTVDFVQGGAPLCPAVTADPGDGLYRCAMADAGSAGQRYVTMRFNSSSDNYRDVLDTEFAYRVYDRQRQIRVSLDDSVDTHSAGDALSYALTVRNQAATGTARLLLGMSAPSGTSGMQWQCVDAGNTSCPSAVLASGNLSVLLDLPPASHLRYQVDVSVADPAPSTIEAIASAQLDAADGNDDPDALIAIDVNLRADGHLFGNGFEAAVPQLKVATAAQALTAWPLPEHLPGSLGAQPRRLLELYDAHGLVGQVQAARVRGSASFRYLAFDRPSSRWVAGEWLPVDAR